MWTYVFASLGYVRRRGLSNSVVRLYLAVKGLPDSFRVQPPPYIPIGSGGGIQMFWSPPPPHGTCCCWLFFFLARGIIIAAKGYFIMVLSPLGIVPCMVSSIPTQYAIGTDTLILMNCVVNVTVTVYFSKCPAGTCDGCTFYFLWESAEACPLCTERDYHEIEGACKRGFQVRGSPPKQNCAT